MKDPERQRGASMIQVGPMSSQGFFIRERRMLTVRGDVTIVEAGLKRRAGGGYDPREMGSL